MTTSHRHVADPGSLADIAREIRAESIDAVQLLERSLERIEVIERHIHAWVSVDRDGARAQAIARGDEVARGQVRGPLHGVPVAIKDVIDVAGWPTRAGSRSRANVAAATIDAEIVAALRAAGAVIVGKVHTTEFAYFDGPPPTRNPHHLAHTPGGSSTGPAAAVAAGMVPLSVGTQTAGSVSRPAAYCGIAAYKPSTLSWSSFGIVPFAPGFDTPGLFGHRVADVAIAARALMPSLLALAPVSAKSKLNIGIVTDAILDAASATVEASMAQSVARLQAGGHLVEPCQSPVPLATISGWHKTMIEYELGRVHPQLLTVPADQVTPALREAVERGRGIDARTYLDARTELAHARSVFWSACSVYDALLFPAAPTTAPAGMKTGDPQFIVPYTALGGPMLSVPVEIAADGLPLGVMLMSAPGTDEALLAMGERAARSIELPR